MKDYGKSKMSGKSKGSKEGLAPENKIVQTHGTSYKSRYGGLLADKKKIVQEKSASSYGSRYS